MTTSPATTLALSLREGGFASAPTPQTPDSLTPHLELTEVALPAPAPGQVVIEVILSPVNPSDLFFVQGGYGQPRVQGQAAGFEGVGRVIAGNGPQAEKLIGRSAGLSAQIGLPLPVVAPRRLGRVEREETSLNHGPVGVALRRSWR